MNSGFIGWFLGGGARTLKHTVGIFITETASFPSVSGDVKSTSWEFTQNPLILKDYNESSKQGNWNPFHPRSFFGMVNKQPSQKGLKIIYYWTRKWMIWSCISKRPGLVQCLKVRGLDKHGVAGAASPPKIGWHPALLRKLKTLDKNPSAIPIIWSHYVSLCWVVGIGMVEGFKMRWHQIMANSWLNYMIETFLNFTWSSFIWNLSSLLDIEIVEEFHVASGLAVPLQGRTRFFSSPGLTGGFSPESLRTIWLMDVAVF